jgi:hypothetical protein
MGMKWVKNIPIFCFQVINLMVLQVSDYASTKKIIAGLKVRGSFHQVLS